MSDLDQLAEYDSDLPIDTAQEKAHNSEEDNGANLLLAEAEALSTLATNPGWKVLKAFFLEQIESHTSKLVQETSFQEIRRLQEYIKACHNLLNYPDAKISEASQFVESISRQQSDLA